MNRLRLVTLCFYVLTILVLAVTSLLPALTGREDAAQTVYSSWPFALLWAVLALLGVACVLRHHLWTRPATFLIHVSLFVILCGAFATRLFGTYGSLHLRTERAVDVFLSDEGEFLSMPFSLRLDTFVVSYYEGSSSPIDFISRVHIVDGGEHLVGQVSMNHILSYRHYRFYQSDFDPDHRGSILLVAHDPFGIAITYLGYALLLLGMLLSFFGRKNQTLDQGKIQSLDQRKTQTWTLAYVGAVVVVVAVVVGLVVAPMFGATPILRSPLLPIHVSLIVSAYVLLTSVMVCGVVALVGSKRGERLRGGRLRGAWGRSGRSGDERSRGELSGVERLRSERLRGERSGDELSGVAWGCDARGRDERLRSVSVGMLRPAVFLLAAGVMVGSVWANVSWGRYWGWDPKEVWALITLMVYALPLHSVPPRHFHLYSVLSFLAVLITFFGANYLIPGLHSYA